MIDYLQRINWTSIGNFFEILYKNIPSIVLTIFSLYFAYRKIFHKLVITYDIVCTGYSQPRISNIIIYNRKDRVEVIKGLNLIINDKFKYEIFRFQVPKIIKPFETIQLETEEVTNYICNFLKYDLVTQMDSNRHYFEIITDKKVVKYIPHKKIIKGSKKEYQTIGVQRILYNGKLINEHVKYAIIYKQNKIQKTAFVYENGVIEGDWNFHFNAFKSDQYINKDAIIKALEYLKFKEQVDSFAIDEIENSNKVIKSF